MPRTPIAFDTAAFETVVVELNRRSLADRTLMARTPGGAGAYPLMAPSRGYGWITDEGSRRLAVRTAEHGPISLLRLTPATTGFSSVDVLVPDPAKCANPDVIGGVITDLHVELAALSANRELTTADRAVLLSTILERAAILLLDPDTEQRQAAIAEVKRRRRDPYGLLPSLDFAEHAASGGGGRRA